MIRWILAYVVIASGAWFVVRRVLPWIEDRRDDARAYSLMQRAERAESDRLESLLVKINAASGVPTKGRKQ